jgi:two-component system response regulator YesN
MSPLKIIIAEDEALIRERLKRMIARSGLDIEVVGEASNGREALVLAQEKRPDLAIVDIEMPLLGGLDFLEEARKSGVAVKALILTGFAQFSYARRAIQLGVVDYLLKPVREQTLREALVRAARESAHETRSARALDDAGRSSRAACLLSMLEHQVEEVDVGEIAAALTRLGSPLVDGPLVVALFHVDAEVPQGVESLRAALRDLASEHPQLDLLPDGVRRLLLVANADRRETILRHFSSDALAALSNGAGGAVTLGCGDVQPGLSGFPRAYQEASAALSTGLLNGGGTLVLFDEIVESEAAIECIAATRSDLLPNLRLGNLEAAKRWLSAALARLHRERAGFETLLLFLSELLMAAKGFAAEIDNFSLLTEHAQTMARRLLEETRDLSRISSWCGELFGRLIEASESHRNASIADAARRIKQYIDASFRDPELTLGRIALQVNLSQGYVSSVFGKATGTSVVEYITELRLEEARRVLETGESNVNEAARAVGYTDPYYFSKRFKKRFGVSPSHFVRR